MTELVLEQIIPLARCQCPKHELMPALTLDGEPRRYIKGHNPHPATSRFKKGHTAYYSNTRFQKGHTPWNKGNRVRND
jgi:hypothetical protein